MNEELRKLPEEQMSFLAAADEVGFIRDDRFMLYDAQMDGIIVHATEVYYCATTPSPCQDYARKPHQKYGNFTSRSHRRD